MPRYARIIRSSVLGVSGSEYVEAARAVGTSKFRIVLEHILPNCLSPMIVNISLNMATLIMSTSILSYLGLGIQAPIPEWGGMLSEGRQFMRENMYLMVYPGLAITFTIIAFNVVGDGLRDAFDPKLKYSFTKEERLENKKRNKISSRENNMAMPDNTILSVSDLSVEYRTDAGAVKALNGITLDIENGKVTGLVGETGAGKTTTALSILNMIRRPPGRVTGGSVLLNGYDILQMNPADMGHIRGNQVSMIFQDPMTALNPTQTVGKQIAEVIKFHEKCSAREAMRKAEDMLELVGIRRERSGDFPHQFSGGMKQRVVIAIALACNPKLLIADEPTTALDVTIQAQVLDVMKSLQEKYGMSMLMITHDLGIVAETCDKVAIVYAGRVVEYGTTAEIFENTLHPYTRGLIDALPNVADRTQKLKPIKGRMVDLANLPKGCAFCDRCEHACQICSEQMPQPISDKNGHYVACHLYNEETVNKGGVC